MKVAVIANVQCFKQMYTYKQTHTHKQGYLLKVMGYIYYSKLHSLKDGQG